MQTISLFPEAPQPSVDQKINRALHVLTALFEASHWICVAFSGGKDSSVVAALALHAAAQFRAAGGVPVVIVTTGDTLVESPEVARHYREEMQRMWAFGQMHDFRVVTKIVTPTLTSTFQVKVLSGRALPSFPGVAADCSVDLKLRPSITYRRQLFRAVRKAGVAELVTCIGTRLDEGAQRAARMRARKESSDHPVRNREGELVLSPIADWSTEDVWEAIALYGSGRLPGYSNFEETKRIYAHSVGTSCAVVADAILEGQTMRRQGKCGARLGCHVCQMAEDKSLANMVEFDERYAYAAGLQRFNRFIRNTRFDWARRHWIGRTIRAGYIKIQPDTYHPRMLREMFRYMLQLDFDELQRSRRAEEAPRFQLLSVEMIIAIDALQSLNGFAKPFAAWADWRDVYERGLRYDVPDVLDLPPTKIPEARFLHVGSEWDDSAGQSDWTCLRDPYFEALTADSNCGVGLVPDKKGRLVLDAVTDVQFGVDAESAMLIQDFEMDRLLEVHDAGVSPGQVIAGYRWYRQFGCLTLSHSQRAEHDEIARRTAFKDRNGWTLDYDVQALLAASVSFTDLPNVAQGAWSHAGKAQTELELV
ncbi:phosphoadenosine phosphosulfate reductase family protein [Ralstonia nicotianae]|uniref:phosphoadenosine phosphosulfate reductase family protein n=1 Tax=Ralstonia pseudosolanacearum TaxID=1310165 RepID=UPI002005698B|nr:phosphoadenosine phosphosulfate reductase family protein [Ralstonia pseudosolanacearum]MCK4120433.1 phosphoadenosine phosphosulfate reductase family protein [Ralstonia pseudosolanacearum]